MNNSESQLRQEIVHIGQLMYEKGFLSACEHAPTIPLVNYGNRFLERLAQGLAAGPQSLPPIQNTALDNDAIRDLVASVGQKTMGELS